MLFLQLLHILLFLCHIVTMSIEGEIMGKNKRGSRRIAWVDNIREWSGGMSMVRNNAWERKTVLT